MSSKTKASAITCVYCGIAWHPSRESKECQANFPMREQDIIKKD